MSAQRDHVLDYDWLHDDLEEELVGADWHQNAIRALSTSLKTLAEEHGLPWHVGDQLTVISEKPDGREWRAGPDISVHTELGSRDRQEIDVREDGPPALVVEVASASTWKYDVSLESTRRGKRQAGKAFGYLFLARICEYLVFDPRGEFLPGQIRAFRRVGDMVQEWTPDAGGRYVSEALGISFRCDEALLRVLDRDGHPIPYWYEAARENARLRQRIAALEAELRRTRQQD
jgi:Uma2 family endonuclease